MFFIYINGLAIFLNLIYKIYDYFFSSAEIYFYLNLQYIYHCKYQLTLNHIDATLTLSFKIKTLCLNNIKNLQHFLQRLNHFNQYQYTTQFRKKFIQINCINLVQYLNLDSVQGLLY